MLFFHDTFSGICAVWVYSRSRPFQALNKRYLRSQIGRMNSYNFCCCMFMQICVSKTGSFSRSWFEKPIGCLLDAFCPSDVRDYHIKWFMSQGVLTSAQHVLWLGQCKLPFIRTWMNKLLPNWLGLAINPRDKFESPGCLEIRMKHATSWTSRLSVLN